MGQTNCNIEVTNLDFQMAYWKFDEIQSIAASLKLKEELLPPGEHKIIYASCTQEATQIKFFLRGLEGNYWRLP